MKIKDIVLNRFRDFDAAIHAEKKLNLLSYVFVRQFAKALRVKENTIVGLVGDNTIVLKGKRFVTRKACIDFLYMSRFYEPETTAFLLSSAGNTLLIVGGHIGRYAVLASDLYNEVVVFEPEPGNYAQLLKNVSLNGSENVTVVNAALSDRTGTGSMVSSLDANTGAAYLVEREADVRVTLETLDGFIERSGMDPAGVQLLLVDAEEHEEKIVNGASRFLSATQATLVIESFNPDSLCRVLSKFGYAHTETLDSRNFVFAKTSPSHTSAK